MTSMEMAILLKGISARLNLAFSQAVEALPDAVQSTDRVHVAENCENNFGLSNFFSTVRRCDALANGFQRLPRRS